MDKPDMATQLAASIASAGTRDFQPVQVAPTQTDAAPVEGKQEATETVVESPAPSTEQPTDESKVQVEEKPDTETPGQSETLTPKRGPDGKFVPAQTKTTEPTTEKPVDGDKGEVKEIDEDALMREALGIPKAEPETVETLRARYENSSKEAHRLVDEAKAKAAALAEAGVEFTTTAEGKFALKANQKYLDSLKDEDLPNVYAKLAEDDKGLVAEDVAKKIVKMALAEVLPKRPIAKATGEDSVLGEAEVERVFSDMAAEKLSNGQPRFADWGDSKVNSYMREIYDRPNMAGFRSWMNQSADNYKQGLSMLHAEVFRIRAPLLAVKKDADAAKKLEQEKLKKKPATVTSGSGITPDAMRSKGTPSAKDSAAAIALKIASAQPS